MNTITIDFETYYDADYSLRKLTIVEYLNDPRFEIIGVAVKVNNTTTEHKFSSFERIASFLSKFDFKNSLVIAHNAHFDIAILEWKFGIKPKKYMCTMLLSRPLLRPFTHRGSVALHTIADFLKIGNKGHEVVQAKGLHLADFSPGQLEAYIQYCIKDVNLCYVIYTLLAPEIPESEHELIHLTLRKFTRPQLKIDKIICETRLAAHTKEKEELLTRAGVADPAILRSNNKFADLLLHLNVYPPTKISPRTGKETYAFAKTDKELLKLLHHYDPMVVAVVEARLGHKTSIEQTRIERFLKLTEFPGSWLPVSLLYYGAHTGRFSGTHKINLQNLTRKSPLRKAVCAPKGYKVLAGDLAQIEARIVACLANQTDLIKAFSNGEDVYSKFASILYGFPVNGNDYPDERFVGKTCILGLGYSMGYKRYMDTVDANPNINMTELEARRTVSVYRNTYRRIPQLWRQMDQAIIAMYNGTYFSVGPVHTERKAIVLPNGMKVHYPGLRKDVNDEWVYDSPTGVKKLYGGALTENIVQALARIILSDAELRLAKRGVFAASQVHDELIYVVKEDKVDIISKALYLALCAPVPWLKGLPIEAEIAFGDSYYDAK